MFKYFIMKKLIFSIFAVTMLSTAMQANTIKIQNTTTSKSIKNNNTLCTVTITIRNSIGMIVSQWDEYYYVGASNAVADCEAKGKEVAAAYQKQINSLT